MSEPLKAATELKANTPGLTVLKESAPSRYFAFSCLYFGQGVPEGVTFGAIPAWLAMNEVAPVQIASYVAAVGLPWSFKLIIAPVMDRYTIKSMGRKRPWVIFGQLGLILSFIAVALIPDPLSNLSMLMLAGFMVSVFGCFQDVATDGMAVDIIPADQQARANGLMWGGKVLGYSVTLSAGSYMINSLGFSTGVLIPALLTSVILLIPICFRERSGEKILPWTAGQVSNETAQLQVSGFKKIFKDISSVFILRSSLVLAAIGFFFGIFRGYTDVVFPLFTIQELGWKNTDFADLSASSYLIGGIAGMLVGGLLVDMFGKQKMLYIYLSVLVALAFSLLFYKFSWVSPTHIAIIIGTITALIVFVNIAFFASCMQHCWPRVSATQFTLYMAISNIGMSSGSAIAGTIRENFNWNYVFIPFALSAGVAFMLIGFLKFQLHLLAVEKLENKELELVEVMTETARL